MKKDRSEAIVQFTRLLDIMDELREKCPWDRKQTFESLRHLTIEETYELSDAILKNDIQEVKKELGDLFLHLIFYSKIASETSQFSIADVLENICDKLILRHPHIYGDIVVDDEETVKKNWEVIKLKEGKKSVLEGVPDSMPALLKSYRMQEKAAGVGFDWDNSADVLAKVVEELKEVEVEFKTGNLEKAEKEMGDVLFAIINFSRFMKINPEDALEKTNKKFKKRFTFMEQKAAEMGKSLKEMSLEEMENIWKQAKKLE